MKILLLNYEFPPLGGGAGRATYNIAKELVRLGNDVDVLTSRIEGQKATEVYEGITLYRVPTYRKNIHDCGFLGAFVYVFFAYFKLLWLVRRNDYDILHYFFSLPTGLLTILPGKQRRIPYIVSLRGSDVPNYDPYNKPLELMHRLLKPLTIRIWNKARAVVALSDSLRQTAKKTAPEQEINVIRNGIDTELFQPLPSRTNGKSLKLFTVCRLLERKGIQHVLTAMAELSDPDISLTVVGLGNYEAKLKALCKQYSLESVVTFRGYCSNETLPAVFQDCDIFILTSLAESFGIVFLEAMACGLPIIGGRTGGIPGIVSAENGILVEPENVEEIKKAILQMRDQPELRREMCQKNRQKAIELYCWRQVARMYQDIYRRETLGVKEIPFFSESPTGLPNTYGK